MNKIHRTAIIEKDVWLDDDVDIGAFSIIRSGSHIGYGTKIYNHVEIGKSVVIGKNNHIHKGVYIGQIPQYRNLSYDNLSLYSVKIGDANQVYEYVTIHLGVKRKTRIGSNNILMGHSHIAHDVEIGSHISIANQVLIAGFCKIENYVFLSGHVSLHPYVRVGYASIVGASLFIAKDVLPYILIARKLNEKFLYGINKEGLKRLDFSYQLIDFIKDIVRILFSKIGFEQKISKLNHIKDQLENEEEEKKSIVEQYKFFINESKRGFIFK